MDAIESLAALRAHLQQQDDELTSSIETLERDRAIVRRQVALVQELVDLQEQRDPAGRASDDEPSRSAAGKPKTGAKVAAPADAETPAGGLVAPAAEPVATDVVAAAAPAPADVIAPRPDTHAGDEPDQAAAAGQGPAGAPDPEAEQGPAAVPGPDAEQGPAAVPGPDAEQGPAAIRESATHSDAPAEPGSDDVAAAEALAAAEAEALVAASAGVERESRTDGDGLPPAAPGTEPTLLARAPIPWPRSSGEPETGLLRRMRAS